MEHKDPLSPNSENTEKAQEEKNRTENLTPDTIEKENEVEETTRESANESQNTEKADEQEKSPEKLFPQERTDQSRDEEDKTAGLDNDTAVKEQVDDHSLRNADTIADSKDEKDTGISGEDTIDHSSQVTTEADKEQNKEVLNEADKSAGEKEKHQEAEEEDKQTVKKNDVTEDDDQEEDLSEKYEALDKSELVELAEAIVENEDIIYIRKHIGYIKVAFRNLLKAENISEYEQNLKEKGEKQEKEDTTGKVDELVNRFEKAFSVYKKKKAIYDQALEKQKEENLKMKEDILEQLRELIESEEELKKTYDVFKELQDKWREVGPIPQNAKGTLWNNYHFLVEKFFDKVKINKELRDLDLKKNLEMKTDLCEKAEELLLEPSVNKSFQKLQKLHEAWKETGPAPKDKKDEIWDRFKAASDAINERRQKFYENLREEQNKNYAAKVVLCEKAEKLIEDKPDSPRRWQEKTDQINELFRVWKTIGFAPKKVNEEIWGRFRSSLDKFFKAKKEFFNQYKEEQNENYNQKLNLCMQAEALKDSEDWKQTTDDLIKLQQQWKKIGPVPRKVSDKIWKRFRGACDEFFNRKAEYFKNIDAVQEENLKKKRELIESIRNFNYSDDTSENLNTLKDFQRQWMDIGHVPIKEKDNIQNEFRQTINEQFDKLNISRKAKSTLGFKNKIENLRNSPNADNIIYKERNFLLNKINNLNNDIKLWENNIGFFASSKKADVLKSEFEKKIEKAKNDITILEEKLKILKQTQ